MLTTLLHVSFSLVLTHYWMSSGMAFSIGSLTVRNLAAPPRPSCSRPLHGTISEYQPMDGEKRINLKVDLDNSKVVTNQEMSKGEKKVFCRCWLSGQFPMCDGAHLKHNAATEDNVGPLIVSVLKQSKSKSLSPAESGRKQRVLWGYRATTIAYLFHVSQWWLAAGVTTLSILSASGWLLAAGLTYILASAAKSDRLSSDTYKRLNLSLIQFGILHMIGLGLVKRNPTNASFAPMAMAIPSVLAIIHGIKGYGYGVLGLDKKSGKTSLVQDFGQGVVSTVKGMIALPKNIKGAVYLAATYFVTGIKFAMLAELVHLVSGTDPLAIVPQLGTYARYAMLWTVLYTLKDAADRGRLDGTTFIELNFLSAGVLAIMSAANGITSPVGGVALVLSLFSAFTGISSIRSKKRS